MTNGISEPAPIDAGVLDCADNLFKRAEVAPVAFASMDQPEWDCDRHGMIKLRDGMGRVIDLDAMIGERARLRREGKRLVFTNGCFDLVHNGHVRYLAEARALGDALAVAVNSDRSVRVLKGEGRPILDESSRAEVLAALACVDYVFIFDDETPREVISKLLPDVLAKGGDWAVEEIVGRDEVEKAGGKVVSLPYLEGSSSTEIIERIKKLG